MTDWNDLIRRAEREHGIVTRDQLHAAGLSERTVTRWADERRLVRLTHGVFRIGGVPPSHAGAVLAAIREFEGDTWASHHSAARLLPLPVWGPEQRIELTRPFELSAQRSVARVHRSTRLPAHHLTVVDAVPCTTASRTLFDLARTTGPVRLGRAMDVALRERMCTMGSLYRVLYDLGGRGRPGTRRMREVLDARGLDHVPAESEAEEVAMALLEGLGFEWQVEMSDERGYIRRVDGRHCPARLVIEVDSRFHDSPAQRVLDQEGDRRLRAIGWDVARLRWREITRDGEATRARIAARLRSAVA